MHLAAHRIARHNHNVYIKLPCSATFLPSITVTLAPEVPKSIPKKYLLVLLLLLLLAFKDALELITVGLPIADALRLMLLFASGTSLGIRVPAVRCCRPIMLRSPVFPR